MKLLLVIPFLALLFIPSIFAEEQVIFSEGKEYEIAETIKEYKISKYSSIIKSQGYTTTGEMFFLRVSPNFEKVMLLDSLGWHKAELRDKVSIEVQQQQQSETITIKDKIELHYILDQYERVYNKSDYKFFVKTFDKSVYSGNDYQNFEGKISGANVSAIITDPNGDTKADFEGIVENGLYEGSIAVPENLWQMGWYTINLVIEFEGEYYTDSLSFYVYGSVVSDGSSSSSNS